MNITGHSNRVMFDRYDPVDVENIRLTVDQMQKYLANVDHSVEQIPKNNKKEVNQ